MPVQHRRQTVVGLDLGGQGLSMMQISGLIGRPPDYPVVGARRQERLPNYQTPAKGLLAVAVGEVRCLPSLRRSGYLLNTDCLHRHRFLAARSTAAHCQTHLRSRHHLPRPLRHPRG
jgi:hypothetical protein